MKLRVINFPVVEKAFNTTQHTHTPNTHCLIHSFSALWSRPHEGALDLEKDTRVLLNCYIHICLKGVLQIEIC